jgi:hypothetical protein
MPQMGNSGEFRAETAGYFDANFGINLYPPGFICAKVSALVKSYKT